MAVFAQTASDILKYFGDLVGEPDASNSRWLLPARKRILNFAQLQIVNETRCIEERWTTIKAIWAAEGDEIVAIPADFYEDSVMNVWWIDASGNMTELKELHPRFDNIQNDDTGTPSAFWQEGLNIYLMPKQSAAGTVRILGKRLPDELDDLTDQSLIPAAYRHLIAERGAYIALLEDGEVNKADRLFAMYVKPGMKKLRAYAQAKRQHGHKGWHMPTNLTIG